MTDLIAVALVVTEALEQCGIRYSVGGSLASSISGEPRASIDADILVSMAPGQIGRLLTVLGPSFYADANGLARAIETGSSTNLIHRATSFKIDLFAGTPLLDQQQLARRRQVHVRADSDRQWRDVLADLVHRALTAAG